MRKAFTLIEMMIAIAVFSLVVIFLYQSYASLNRSNRKYGELSKRYETMQKIRQTIYLDFSLVLDEDIAVYEEDVSHDVVFIHTSNSIHNRVHPYVAYITKDGVLYRMESLRKFRDYPLEADRIGDVDVLGEIKRFRVYAALKKDGNNTKQLYLVDTRFKNGESILYKIAGLNQ